MRLKKLKGLIDAVYAECGNIPVEIIRRQGKLDVVLEGEIFCVSTMTAHDVSRIPKRRLWLKIKKGE